MKNTIKNIAVAVILSALIPASAIAAAFKINQVIDPVTPGVMYSSGSATGNLTATTAPSLSGITVSGTSTLSGGIRMASGTSLFYGTSALIDSSGNINATVLPLSDTAANLASVVPLQGQMVYATDTKMSYVGDGTHSVSSLLPIGFWTGNGTQISFPGRITTGTTTDQNAGFYGARDAVGAVSQRWIFGTPATPASTTNPYNTFDPSGDFAAYFDMSANPYTSDPWSSIGGVGISGFDVNEYRAYGVASYDPNAWNFFLGNVGIGTASPDTALSVTGTTTTSGLRISGLANKVLSTDAQGNVVATTSSSGTVASGSQYQTAVYAANGSTVSGTSTITIRNENVGVGTTSPFTKLTVGGAGYFTGNLSTVGSLVAGPLAATLSPAAGEHVITGEGSSGNPVKLDFFTNQGAGAAQINFLTFGAGSGLTQIPASTFAFYDRNGYTGQSVFSVHGYGGPGIAQVPVLAIGSGGSDGGSGHGFGIAVGAAYAGVAKDIPNNGAIIQGNVGIGTSSPSNRLEVSGNSYLGGNVTATGTLSVSATTTTAGLKITGLLNKVLSTDASGNVVATTTSGGGATVSGTDGQILVKSGSNAVGSSTPSVTAINATSTTATSSFSGYVKIGDGTAPRGIFDVGKVTTVPTPSAGTGVTFLYDDPASEADYSDDGGTYTFEIVAYINGAWTPSTGLTLSGTDTLATFGHTMDIVVNWLPVSGASKYRVYIHDFQNTGCDFTCYYETGMNGENPATTTVIFGQSPRPENVVVSGTLPLTPNQYGPSLYAANDGIHANNLFADYFSATTASSTWYGDGSNLTGVMKNPANVTVDFGGQYVKNAYRIGIATSSNPNYRLDIANANSISSSIHWSKNGAAGGGYLMSAATGNSFWSTGAYHNGSQWIATDANPVIFGAGANNDGNFTVYTDSGKTLNSSFSPTERLRFDTSGNLTVTGTMKPSSGYKSADGSSGTSATVTYLKDLSTTCTMTIKNGIITAITGASCP